MTDILNKALDMLEKHPLCDHCLGRQFALLGYGLENDERGRALKLGLALQAHAIVSSHPQECKRILETLATNGFLEVARELMLRFDKPLAKKESKKSCYLCENKLENVDKLVSTSLASMKDIEFDNFLVGVELPIAISEREDEFKAKFDVTYGEDLRNEFARIVGKRISKLVCKDVDFKTPHVTVLVNPFSRKTKAQVKPLFIFGSYRKLVRDIPQSKWFCSDCHGKGCIKCNWTGKMYNDSVQEIIEKPFLEATQGIKTSFHASGREDIDARMLGNGRPFVLEISGPKKRTLNLIKIKKMVNLQGRGKVKISHLEYADRDAVRKLKRNESLQKEYRITLEFENPVSRGDLVSLEKSLTNVPIKQKTPVRVLHRRADLTREKYIYELNVKRLSPKKAEMKLRCQGGLYIKELVTGDEGRTIPNVSQILNNRTRPRNLDVLNIIMKD